MEDEIEYIENEIESCKSMALSDFNNKYLSPSVKEANKIFYNKKINLLYSIIEYINFHESKGL